MKFEDMTVEEYEKFEDENEQTSEEIVEIMQKEEQN